MDSTLSFKRYLLYSLCLHILAFILFMVLSEERNLRPASVTKITMINLAPRLGSSAGQASAPPGLPPVPEAPPELPPPVEAKQTAPKLTAPPQQTKAPPPPQQEGPKAPIAKKQAPLPQKPVPQTQKADKPDESKITQALSGIEEEIKERETQLQSAPPAVPPGSPTRPGEAGLGSPDGTITARDPGYVGYQSQVRSKIIQGWVRTHAGSETQRLRARVLVRINAAGAVISKVLTQSSGDASFDNSALRAVERASPFPPPPEGIQREALGEGFVVDFSSRVLGKN